ncbi:MAG: Inosine/uridine-preferring nucleoside hydrolase, partial [Edaphobacter sp.]|nr:Inosine/uridine-preferring nucleoside hydrolase [Edaphobacter sp.]
MRCGSAGLQRSCEAAGARTPDCRLAQTGEHGISLPDPVAMAVLLDPTIKLDESRHYVAIECSSDFSRGMTVVDRLDVATDPRNAAVWSEIMRTSQKVEVCWRIDVP